MVNNKLIKKIPSMHDKTCVTRVVKNIPLLKNKYNLSLVGMKNMPNL